MGGGGQEGPGEAPGIEPGGPGSRPCALCSRCRCLPWERGAAGDGLVPLRFQVHWWKPKPPAASPPSGASQWRRVGGTPPRTRLSRRVREGGREGGLAKAEPRGPSPVPVCATRITSSGRAGAWTLIPQGPPCPHCPHCPLSRQLPCPARPVGAQRCSTCEAEPCHMREKSGPKERAGLGRRAEGRSG